MATVNINRDEAVAIEFTITDPNDGLTGQRVTWSVAEATGYPKVLQKQSGMGASSADVEIKAQSMSEISGLIHMSVADFSVLLYGQYRASLWLDSGVGDDRCVTPGGADLVIIVPNVARG